MRKNITSLTGENSLERLEKGLVCALLARVGEGTKYHIPIKEIELVAGGIPLETLGIAEAALAGKLHEFRGEHGGASSFSLLSYFAFEQAQKAVAVELSPRGRQYLLDLKEGRN